MYYLTCPKYLYKFYPDHNIQFPYSKNLKDHKEELDKRISALNTPYLHCSNKPILNDPFEFQFKLSEYKSRKELLEYYRIRQGVEGQIVDLEALEQFLLDDKEFERIRRKASENTQRIYREIEANARVCSFTRRYNSILMWAHYANNHMGFCLKFNMDSMLDIKAHARRVTYSRNNNFPVLSSIDIIKKGADWTMGRTLATKHKGWSYEKEWRVLAWESQLYYQKEAVSQVLLGCRSSVGLEQELREYFPNAEFLRAISSDKGFRLSFERCR